MCAAVLHALLVQPDRAERGSGAQRFVKVLTDEPKGRWIRWTGVMLAKLGKLSEGYLAG